VLAKLPRHHTDVPFLVGQHVAPLSDVDRGLNSADTLESPDRSSDYWEKDAAQEYLSHGQVTAQAQADRPSNADDKPGCQMQVQDFSWQRGSADRPALGDYVLGAG